MKFRLHLKSGKTKIVQGETFEDSTKEIDLSTIEFYEKIKPRKKGWHEIKISATDRLYSIYRRMLTCLEDTPDYGVCAFKITLKCELRGGIWNWKHQLVIVHFHSRGKFSVKYNDKNTDVGCVRCHKYLHAHPTEHEAWKLAQLGKGNFLILLFASQILVRKSDQIIIEETLRDSLKGKIKELEKL